MLMSGKRYLQLSVEICMAVSVLLALLEILRFTFYILHFTFTFKILHSQFYIQLAEAREVVSLPKSDRFDVVITLIRA